jgi:hypothetical protein
MAEVVVTRKHVNGNLTGAIFLIDLMSKGLKDAVELFNKFPGEVEEMLENMNEVEEMVEIPYSLAHNIIYTGIEYAGEEGYSPFKNTGVAQYVLEEDTDEIEWVEIPTGQRHYEDEYVDDSDDDDWDEEDEYSLYTAEDWLEFLKENKDFDPASRPEVTNGLFWYLIKKEYGKAVFEGPFHFEDIPLTFEPLPYNYPAKVARRMEELQVEIISTKAATDLLPVITETKELMQKYPDNRSLLNILAQAYQLAGEKEKYLQTLKETVTKFPDYVTGKISYGNALLEEDKLAEFEKIFPAPYTMQAAFPERDTFHFTEVIPFIGTLLRYFVKKNDLLKATQFSELMFECKIESKEIESVFSSNVEEVAQEEFFEKKVAYVSESLKGEMV